VLPKSNVVCRGFFVGLDQKGLLRLKLVCVTLSPGIRTTQRISFPLPDCLLWTKMFDFVNMLSALLAETAFLILVI